MVPYSKVSGKKASSSQENVSFQTGRSTMDSGTRANLKASALKFGLMVVVTKETGTKENLSEKVLRLTRMDQPSEANGKVVFL